MKLVENNKSAVKSYKLLGPPHVQRLNWRIALSVAAKVECKIYRTNSSGLWLHTEKYIYITNSLYKKIMKENKIEAFLSLLERNPSYPREFYLSFFLNMDN